MRLFASAAHRFSRARRRYPDSAMLHRKRRRRICLLFPRLRRRRDPPWGVARRCQIMRSAGEFNLLKPNTTLTPARGEGKNTEHPQDAIAFMQAGPGVYAAERASSRFGTGAGARRRGPIVEMASAMIASSADHLDAWPARACAGGASTALIGTATQQGERPAKILVEHGSVDARPAWSDQDLGHVSNRTGASDHRW